MNLFTFRKMEEDHYTNILMSILTSSNYALLPFFIEGIIGDSAEKFEYEDLRIDLFAKSPAIKSRKHQYLIGIAPFTAIDRPNSLENNLDSTPDAWISGKNFTLLFEFKIRGTLDEAQLAAHKMKLSNCMDIIRIEWADVIQVLEKLKKIANDLQVFLLDEFIAASTSFNKKRPSSGMPNEIIGGRNKEGELYFIITGSKEIGRYTVDINFPDGRLKNLKNDLRGIQESRRWIANYVCNNTEEIHLDRVSKEAVITDLCVKPGRQKNAWNQWRLGSYL